ncbi:MAG: hypothetical protein ACTJHC_01635 [Vagococcus sp.]
MYMKKNQQKLEVLFSVDNRKTLRALSTSFIGLSILGLTLSVLLPTRDMALTYIAIVLMCSAIFTIQLSKKMTH